jgi:hypothetical protein
MRNPSLFSIFGIALCMSAAVVACSGDDDDDKAPATTPSGQGESCVRTGDCASGLVCIDQVCEKKGSSSGGNAGNDGSGGSSGGTKATGGTAGNATGGSAGKAGSAGSSTIPAPVLGGEGESCTRAADCAADLHCFNQRCTKSGEAGAGGQGGEGSTNPPPTLRLAQQGETCTLSSDCDSGLVCLPGGQGFVGEGFVGVCSVASAGITPTGSDCHAECTADTDCCELPPSLLTALDIKSCADLSDLLSNVDCGDPGGFAEECFVEATYCQCTSSTWKCSGDGQCVYNLACSNDGLTTDGCATVSRSDKTLVATCNDSKCELAAVDPTCTRDSDCEGKGVADDGADTCSTDECTCFKADGECYRKCAVDLDCRSGSTCDTKTHVCMAAAECTEDLNCQQKNQNVNSVCDTIEGLCKTKCTNDLECNVNLTGDLTQVCGSDHVCAPIGCTQDSDCTTTTDPPVHMFCTTQLTVSEAAGPESAVTGGP